MKVKKMGNIIREAREKKKLTRPQVAKKLGISAQYVAHMENECISAMMSDELFVNMRNVLAIKDSRFLRFVAEHNARWRKYKSLN